MPIIYTIFISILTVITTATAVQAQTPVTDEMTQSYYVGCLQDREERISETAQNELCRCTTTQYKNKMDVETLQDLAGNDPTKARLALNELIVKLYTPCMEGPIRSMVYQKCTQDAAQAGEQVCECLADNMAHYVSERAQGELGTILKNNPNVYDPFDAITSSASYEAHEKRVVMECIKKNL